jgi:hypothetical protein
VYERYVKPLSGEDWAKPDGAAIQLLGSFWLLRSGAGEPVIWPGSGQDTAPGPTELIGQITSTMTEALVRLQQNAHASAAPCDVLQRFTVTETGGWWMFPYTIPRDRPGWAVEEIRGNDTPSWRQYWQQFPRELNLHTLKEIQLLRPLLSELARLTTFGCDGVPIYATLVYSGHALRSLATLAGTRAYEEGRKPWRAQVIRAQRSLRSLLAHLRRCRDRLPADPVRQLEADLTWQLRSLERIAYPSPAEIGKSHRRLRVHRPQAFWTDLIRYAVGALRTAAVGERPACEAVRVMLNTAFPSVRHWTLGAVKGRYYQSL